MSNNEYWKKLCSPPSWALKPIQAGRLKGKSDINPQWRMKVMTEVFGPCGIGWKYSIDKLWAEAGHSEQVMAMALVSVFVRVDDRWSDPVPGVGGSMLIEQESRGMHTSDEGYKMAVTDALSVAFKALGVAADIYQGEEWSKYQKAVEEEEKRRKLEPLITDLQRKMLMAMYGGMSREDRLADANYILGKAKPGTEISSFSDMTELMAAYLIKTLNEQKAAMGE